MDWRWRGPDLNQGTQRTRPACLLAVISHVVNAKIFVVSTKARRAARRDLLSPISRLSLNEGLSAPRFALRSRRRKSCRSVSDYLQGRWRLVDAGRFTRRAQFPKCTLGSNQRTLPSFGGSPATICQRVDQGLFALRRGAAKAGRAARDTTACIAVGDASIAVTKRTNALVSLVKHLPAARHNADLISRDCLYLGRRSA